MKKFLTFIAITLLLPSSIVSFLTHLNSFKIALDPFIIVYLIAILSTIQFLTGVFLLICIVALWITEEMEKDKKEKKNE